MGLCTLWNTNMSWLLIVGSRAFVNSIPVKKLAWDYPPRGKLINRGYYPPKPNTPNDFQTCSQWEIFEMISRLNLQNSPGHLAGGCINIKGILWREHLWSLKSATKYTSHFGVKVLTPGFAKNSLKFGGRVYGGKMPNFRQNTICSTVLVPYPLMTVELSRSFFILDAI